MTAEVKKRKISALALGALLASSIQTQAFAQDDERAGGIYDAFKRSPFSASFSAGVEYDSNISVIEIDTATQEDDFAAVLDFGVGFEKDVGEDTKFKAGYDFGQDLQFDVTAFDTQSHRGSAELSHNFGVAEIGASYNYVYSKLGGDGFLSVHRLSPYAATYVAGKKAYLRATYIYTDKDFVGRIDRDSEVNAGGAEAFIFLNGLKTYVIAGYRYEVEDAVSPEFDFNAHNVKARLIQSVPLGAKPGKFKIGWRFEDRNYDSVTPSILAVRNDERQRFDASFEIPLSEVMFAEIEYRYDDFRSNLPSADFTQNVATIRFGGRL